MARRILLGLLLITLLAPALAVVAQAPEPINAALRDLSSRAGRTVNLTDLTNWSYVQSNFPDASLGCPQPGLSYAQVVTGGFQFVLTYNGTTYDYRVSNDQTIVILCSSSAAPTPTGLAEVCPPPGDPGFLTPRLTIGTQARVEAGGFPNLIRSLPGTSGDLLGQIEAGATFDVVAGPRCSLLDKIVWWQVNYNGITGWTAEGDDGDYWLEPLNLQATPAPALSALTTSNAAQMKQVAAGTGVMAVSPDEKLIALGSSNGSIAIYDSVTLAPKANLSGHAGAVNALAFGGATGGRLVSAGEDGLLIVWQVAVDGSAREEARLVSGTPLPLRSVAITPDGSLIAAGAADGTIVLWDPFARAALATLSGHSTAVVSLSFSAKGALLTSRDENGDARIWGVTAGGSVG
jgi:WD40 repeat protein